VTKTTKLQGKKVTRRRSVQVTVCQKRVEIVLTRHLRTIAAEARRLANDVQALLSPMAERAQTQVTRMVEQASVLMKQHMS